MHAVILGRHKPLGSPHLDLDVERRRSGMTDGQRAHGGPRRGPYRRGIGVRNLQHLEVETLDHGWVVILGGATALCRPLRLLLSPRGQCAERVESRNRHDVNLLQPGRPVSTRVPAY